MNPTIFRNPITIETTDSNVLATPEALKSVIKSEAAVKATIGHAVWIIGAGKSIVPGCTAVITATGLADDLGTCLSIGVEIQFSHIPQLADRPVAVSFTLAEPNAVRLLEAINAQLGLVNLTRQQSSEG